MSEPKAACCAIHGYPLIPCPTVPGALMCPEADCGHVIGGFPLPPSPLGPMEIQAARNHELVCTYEQAGFSRSEAMQILSVVIWAGIVKDRGGDSG